jgi:HD-like signal output (HDOD) protein
MGLRAAFPPAPELEPLWKRAALRGLVMGRLGQRLGLDAWASHSAGLFEECGKAVLFRHAPDHYRSMLRAAPHDGELVTLEHAGFGVSHDALGAALCESWGLAPAAVASVRQHVLAQAGGPLPEDAQKRAISALSVVTFGLMADRPRAPGLGDADDETDRVARQAGLDAEALQRFARQVHEQLTAAVRHGRADG